MRSRLLIAGSWRNHEHRNNHRCRPARTGTPRANCRCNRRQRTANDWPRWRHSVSAQRRKRALRRKNRNQLDSIRSLKRHIGSSSFAHSQNRALLRGSLGKSEATFRGKEQAVRTGETIHIPSNAPHQFQNRSDRPARMLCICSPAGQEDFFMKVGNSVTSRTAAPPKLDEAGQRDLLRKVQELAPMYRTQLLQKA